MEITRRTFVAGSAALGMVAAAGGVTAFASEADGQAGIYIGSAQGNSGTVYVKVAVGEQGGIDSVEIVGNSETDHLIHEVAAVLPARIVEAQSTSVDVVAGATFTSFAVIGAVEDALRQAGIDPAGLISPAREHVDETENCQVLVVGSGPAGLMAALTARQRGADVLLIDQLDIAGGTGRFSAGRMFGTMEPERIGELKDAFMVQTTACQKPYDESKFPVMEKIDQYINSGCEMFGFLTGIVGIDLAYYAPKDGWGNENTKVQMGENPYSEVSSTMGYQLTSSLYEAYLSLGGRARLGARLESLVKNDAGKIVGAQCSTKAGALTIEADYVIMCTGSAGANPEVMAVYAPERADGDPRTICRGADGSGMLAMVDAGAVVIEDWINSAAQYSVHPELACTSAGEGHGDAFALSNTLANKSCLFVDESGKRLGDESNSFVTLLYYKPGQIDHIFAVMDVDSAVSRGIVADLEGGLASQPEYFFKAGSVEELAEAMGVDASALAATVAEYNEACEAGEDANFGKDAGSLVSIATAPFYAVKEILVNRDIAGGVYTALDRSVVDSAGEPIEGLYAAGFCSSRDLYGNGIPGAGSVGMSTVTGYVAANSVADAMGL